MATAVEMWLSEDGNTYATQALAEEADNSHRYEALRGAKVQALRYWLNKFGGIRGGDREDVVRFLLSYPVQVAAVLNATCPEEVRV